MYPGAGGGVGGWGDVDGDGGAEDDYCCLGGGRGEGGETRYGRKEGGERRDDDERGKDGGAGKVSGRKKCETRQQWQRESEVGGVVA